MINNIESQIRGLTAIVLVSAIIPLIIFFSNVFFFNYKLPFLINQENNPLIVEIEDMDAAKGIYFTMPGKTANQLMAEIGSRSRAKEDFLLENGMRLKANFNSPQRVTSAKIDNAGRLALGMPIDLNGATEDDLLLINGIGIKTADRILKFRSEKKRFRDIEQLMEIEGIKDKKLAKWRKYLYVQKQ
jgi:competence ComEA-like helix-hairpin-helix protein